VYRSLASLCSFNLDDRRHRSNGQAGLEFSVKLLPINIGYSSTVLECSALLIKNIYTTV
jgi:hypothetical protein